MARVLYKPVRSKRKKKGRKSPAKKPKRAGPFNERTGPRVKNWAVGITIAPREEEYHTRTVDSVIASGWESPHLFVEPGTELEDRHLSLNITQRKEKYGCWKNWFSALRELLETYPEADCYGLIQDDVVFCKGVRLFLENVLWPTPDTGVASVFTPSHYTGGTPGFYRRNFSGKLWMAQTFFFPPSVARDCIEHKICVRHKGEKNIDNIVGRWLNAIDCPPYYFSPSLAQHVGEKSTLWNNKYNQARGRKAAKDFVGEHYDISHGMQE